MRSRPKTEVHYGNGPVWRDAGLPELPNWTVLARYESEIRREGAPQTSAGRTARCPAVTARAPNNRFANHSSTAG